MYFIISLMISKSFKISLATISLLLAMGMTVGQMFVSAFGGCYHFACYVERFVFGPITLALYIAFYIAFLKTKKDLFFWLSLFPLIVWFVAVFVFKLS